MGASMRALDDVPRSPLQGLPRMPRLHATTSSANAIELATGSNASDRWACERRRLACPRRPSHRPAVREAVAADRVTFTIGVRELGGDMVEIPADVMHADREPIDDVARNLERWVDAVVIRTFARTASSRSAPRRRDFTSSTR